MACSRENIAQLCMTFPTHPEPIAPTCMTVLAIASSIGLTPSSTSASPPTSTVRSRVWAPSLPPLTGASSIVAPLLTTSPCTFFTSSGELVVWSI